MTASSEPPTRRRPAARPGAVVGGDAALELISEAVLRADRRDGVAPAGDGEPPDAVLDRLFPAGQRFRSRTHWTPADVAARACALLAAGPGQRVLDVGAGVGKLCVVGALTTRASWVGVERELAMIRAGEKAVRRLGLERRVEFIHGDATALDWAGFDAIYLYNPFCEGLYRPDLDAGSRRERYARDIAGAQRCLASTRPGTRVVTYHGFGGDMPDGFELVHREVARGDQLCAWVRRPRP